MARLIKAGSRYINLDQVSTIGVDSTAGEYDVLINAVGEKEMIWLHGDTAEAFVAVLDQLVEDGTVYDSDDALAYKRRKAQRNADLLAVRAKRESQGLCEYCASSDHASAGHDWNVHEVAELVRERAWDY